MPKNSKSGTQDIAYVPGSVDMGAMNRGGDKEANFLITIFPTSGKWYANKILIDF